MQAHGFCVRWRSGSAQWLSVVLQSGVCLYLALCDAAVHVNRGASERLRAEAGQEAQALSRNQHRHVGI
jgi:hypothetical protein